MLSLFHTISILALLLSVTLASNSPRDTPTIYNESNKYAYYGCFNETTDIPDSAKDRALYNGTHIVQKGTMTVPMCLSFCTANNTEFTYAGLEWSRECWCSNRLSLIAEKLDDGACSFPCEGNSSQICGGSLKLSVYTLSSAPNGIEARTLGLLIIASLAGLLLS